MTFSPALFLAPVQAHMCFRKTVLWKNTFIFFWHVKAESILPHELKWKCNLSGSWTHGMSWRQSASWTAVSAAAGCQRITLNVLGLMGCAWVWRWRDIGAHWRWLCQASPSLLLSSECHSTTTLKHVAAPWFNGIIIRAQIVLPACLCASPLIPPFFCSKPIQLCGFSHRCGKVRVMEDGWMQS